MTEKKKVAEKKENAVVELTNTFEQDSTTFDGMTTEDMALPFLRLLTNMSPQIGEVQGAQPGMIFNTATNELFAGDEGVLVIPCQYVRQYIEWAPRGGGTGAPVNIYPATSDILSKTHKEPGDYKDYLENGNYIEATANHYVLIVSDDRTPEPALISMKSTQLKKSRKWNSMMVSVKMKGSGGKMFTPPMYSQIYRLTTTSESNDRGKWHGWDIVRVGAVESAAVYEAAKAFSASIKDGEVDVKHESDDKGADGETHDLF